MVARGERKNVWGRSNSFSSRPNNYGADDASFRSAYSFQERAKGYASRPAPRASTFHQRYNLDEESQYDIDGQSRRVIERRFSTTSVNTENVESAMARTQSRTRRPHMASKASLLSNESSMMESQASMQTDASSMMESNASKLSDTSSFLDYDDEDLRLSRSYDSLWGDRIDRKLDAACNLFPIRDMERTWKTTKKTWKSTKHSIKKQIPLVKADIEDVQAAACVGTPKANIKRIKKDSLQALNDAKGAATQWAASFYTACDSDEDFEEAEINDLIEDKDLILDVNFNPSGGDKIVDEFRKTFSEGLFQPKVAKKVDGSTPPVLSADGQVIHQYVVDVATLGRGQTPAQKWSR